jgi:hypothetical protein
VAEGGPFYDQELKDFFNDAKKAAMKNFIKVAVGDDKEKFLDDFKEKMR